jgi:hypothetical protein
MLTVQSITVNRNGRYEDHKPNQLVTQIRMADTDGNRQELTLDDATTLEILRVVREAATAQAKKTAAETKTAVDSALAEPLLEGAAAQLSLT